MSSQHQPRQGSAQDLPDVAAFVACLDRLHQHPTAEVRDLFVPGEEIFVSRAPGRLDVMGGIADYSGSLVLQLPIREAALVALQRDAARRLRIVSMAEGGGARCFEAPLSALEREGAPLDYASALSFFRLDPGRRWAGYAAGAFVVLSRERGVAFPAGARLLIASQIPEGSGVSSSAALEVAVLQAVTAAFGVSLAPRELALLAQRVENHVVGAPCGVMDQMTAACGEADRLLALLCQPAELQDSVPIPEDLAIWGIDSGVRHSVGSSAYASVRAGAFMGYRMIAERAGLAVQPLSDGDVRIEDTRWGGYLANLTPSEFHGCFGAQLPERMQGAEFIARYGGTTDPLSRVAPDLDYAVRDASAHPVHEHFRARAFSELLVAAPSQRRCELLGELMYQSHASYSGCGLGSPGTDRLVSLVREAGPSRGLYGARITGGGCGGTVAVLGRREAGRAVAAIAERYAGESGHAPRVFSGSSGGAAAFGHLRLRGGR